MKIKWWHKSVCYQIYTASFMDSNGDGIGDIDGIIEKLPYLAKLGIGAIWLTPFYPSPMVDNGYDISDYCNVDEKYGTLTSFKKLVEQAKKLGINIIIDIVINHISTSHAWFKEVLANPNSTKKDYFIWYKEKPNNWESYFGGSAWEYVESQNAYYYHAFAKEQINLNWLNPQIMVEIKQVLKFWLDLGVKGFRFDVINFLQTDKENMQQNNPYKNNEQEHLYDQNQPSIYKIVSIIADYIKMYDEDIFLIGEVGSEDIEILATYPSKTNLDVVFNFNVGSQKTFNLPRIVEEIQSVYNHDILPTLFFSSHDMQRAYGRFFNYNEKQMRLLFVLQLLFEGVPFIYYGEEIGMYNNTLISIDSIQDIQGRNAYDLAISDGVPETIAFQKACEKTRDYSRGVMIWENNKQYGFTEGIPWIDSPNKTLTSVNEQVADNQSLFNFVKELITLKNSNSILQYGVTIKLQLFTKKCIKYVRKLKAEQITIYINFSPTERLHIQQKGKTLLIVGHYENGVLGAESACVFLEKKT